MREEIRINYSDVMKKASQIKGDSFELFYRIYQLRMIKNTLQQDWESPASRVYIKKLDQLIEKISMTRKKMCETAELIEMTARAIQRADLAAQEQARQL